jgi:hypothetical protein
MMSRTMMASKGDSEAGQIDRAVPRCRRTQNVEIYGNTVGSSYGSKGIRDVDIDRTVIASASTTA